MERPLARGYDRCPQPLGDLRLDLADEFNAQPIDGCWWPHSRDLTREGSQLVNEFPASRGRIDRMAYSETDWDSTASHVFTSRGRVKVGHLQPRELHLLLVRLRDGRVLRLLVVHHRVRQPQGAARASPGRRPR